MKVILNVSLSGTRNGVDWPARGSMVDMPAGEAVDMLNAGLAIPAAEPTVERAVIAAPVEKAVRARKSRA